jgi:predicted O-methyltransferase YrrM
MPTIYSTASSSSCVVLVPIGGAVDPGCDDALRELEKRGYPVWRVRGYSAVDAARNQMATDALAQRFDELIWIDSDIAFDPDDVDQLRAHNLPITCGIYPKKGPRQFACEFLPDTSTIGFGRHGGLVEIKYCGFGFTHTRREVFKTVQKQLRLPICNKRFESPLIPFFEPMSVQEATGPWSISEDYAFCERARQCGFKIMADTRIRLWHVGPYRYGWEDAGNSEERYSDYTFHVTDSHGKFLARPTPPATLPTEGYTEDWFSYNVPVWERVLAPLIGKPVQALEIGVFEGRSSVWLLEHVLTHVDSTLTWIDTFQGGSDHVGMNLTGLETRFRANTVPFGKRVNGHVGRSQDVLRTISGERFDLVYIDGSHEAPDVLTDAVLAWPLLKPGGLMGFDDYGWRGPPEPQRCPALAVDAFLDVMRGCHSELHRGYQVWVQKQR